MSDQKPVAAKAPAAPAVPTAPVASSQEYFNSSKLRVIGLILAGSGLIGALGGIAGVAFDPSPSKPGPLIQPGSGNGSTVTPKVTSPGSIGNSVGTGRFDLGLQPRADATVSPSPTGGVLGSDSASPETSPSSEPTDGSTSGDTGDNGDQSGDGKVTITSSNVDVYVPDGWTVDNTADNEVWLSDGNGSYALAATGTVDASAAAADVINANLEDLLPAENYTQRQVDTPTDLGGFGSVVSFAGLGYQALWVDNQGSANIRGQIYAGVRQDGTVLIMLIEHIPGDDWDTAFETEKPIIENTFNRFGGVE